MNAKPEPSAEKGTDPFCPRCDVVMDLHPSTEPWGCEVAEQKADLLNRFDSIFLPQHPPYSAREQP